MVSLSLLGQLFPPKFVLFWICFIPFFPCFNIHKLV
ncbi:hypothetical protein BVRB_2g027110 [Beta vulgaris subsp. vulgaris]|nr:hypothetical protein BVRB_2g027110 [Beta vulgaris subsp. vulgaris]